MTEDRKIKKDIDVIANFVKIYCQNSHNGAERKQVRIPAKLANYFNGHSLALCDECRKLLLHSVVKRIQCPFVPKPACKKCPAHCYAPNYRKQMKEVMKFSGQHLIKKGRLDLIFKFYF